MSFLRAWMRTARSTPRAPTTGASIWTKSRQQFEHGVDRRVTILDEVSKLTCDLVAIESVNPDLVARGSGESAIAAFVASWLRDHDLVVESIEPVPGRPSVVG